MDPGFYIWGVSIIMGNSIQEKICIIHKLSHLSFDFFGVLAL